MFDRAKLYMRGKKYEKKIDKFSASLRISIMYRSPKYVWIGRVCFLGGVAQELADCQWRIVLGAASCDDAKQ